MKKFVINLKESTDRLENVKSQLEGTIFADAERFDAFDARKLDAKKLHELFDYEVFEQRKKRLPRPGEIGCYMSHLGLWKRCIEEEKPILIFEDDLKRIRDFDQAQMNVAEEWISSEKPRALLLQDNYKTWKRDISEITGKENVWLTICNPFEVWCMHAYMLNPAAACILASERPSTVADDWQLYRSLGVEVAAVVEPVFTQNNEQFGTLLDIKKAQGKPSLTTRLHHKLRNTRESLLASLGLLRRF